MTFGRMKKQAFLPMAQVHLHFKVAYLTKWGQHLYLRSRPTADSDFTSGCEMSCRWEGTRLVWEATLTLPLTTDLYYKYVVVNDAGLEEKAENVVRVLSLDDRFHFGDRLEVRDTWQDASSPYAVVASGAFRRAIGLPEPKGNGTLGQVPGHVPESRRIIVRFVVRDWMCRRVAETGRQQMYVTGGLPNLGNWQQDKVKKLIQTREAVWEGEVTVACESFPFTYKYALNSDKGLILESGESRFATLRSEGDCPSMVVLEDGHFRHEKLWKGAGVAVPVFSLRSRGSLGVGEFSDLKLLVDMCVKFGLDVVQILPVNDTSVHKMWWDSYPYSSLSVFALHPVYLRVDALMDEMPKEIAERIDEARERLDGPEVDYEATYSAKMELAGVIYQLNGMEALKSCAFEEFFESNAEWLEPYAAFIYLQDLFETAEHWRWGKMGCPTEEDIARIVSPDHPRYFYSIGFTYWLQFHLHRQLHEVKCYAEENRVALKGDLPIGVDKCSVDTWMYPTLFRMDKSTGAPPDNFDANGQNWRFPTYNWEEMEKDDYSWWRKRLHQMSKYFHAYRIDHILGFFRIWEIPETSSTAMLGRFRPSHPIHRHELESRGIWDIDRLCKPHVTWALLEKYFSDLAPEVSTRYFTEDERHFFHLRENFDTEMKVTSVKPRYSVRWLETETEVIKDGLLQCVQNVVLIRHPTDGDIFYPRFDLMSTESFRGLHPHWQQELRSLHDEYFYNRQNDLWREHALKTLPALIKSSDMLVCGEDLGMIPACVHPVMEELGLIGMRIQRMPTDGEFGDPMSYPYLTVCCAACHDVSTIRAWWEEDHERSERFYNACVHGDGPAPVECTPEIVKRIVQQHFQSPSILAILQIQDIFGLSPKYNTRPPSEEAINDPTNPRHYWRYRMHIDLETLIEDQELAESMHNMLRLGSRGKHYWMDMIARALRHWTWTRLPSLRKIRTHVLTTPSLRRSAVACTGASVGKAPTLRQEIHSPAVEERQSGVTEEAQSVKVTQQQVDYTTLCASVAELQSWIPSRVEQVVQWHQQCVAMRLRNEQSMTWMYISWHPVAARINCGEPPQRGNASEGYSFGEALRKALNGLILIKATLPHPFERVVCLLFSESSDREHKHALWCEVMGRHSNVILTDSQGSIRLCAQQIGTKMSSVRQLQVGRQYEAPPTQSGIPPDSLNSKEEFYETLNRVAADDRYTGAKCELILVRSFQGMSPCLARELLLRASIDTDSRFQDLSEEHIDRLYSQWQSWLSCLDANSFNPTLSEETRRYSLMGSPGVWFKSVHALMDVYYRSIEVDVGASQISRTLSNAVKKSLTRLETRRKKLVASLKDADKADATQKTGDLIIANLHNYIPGSASLKVVDWETGESTEVQLDPLKSAVECAQVYFKRAKKQRRAAESVTPLLESVDQEITYMREVEESLVELDASDDEADAQAMVEIQEELIQGGYMKPPSDHHLASKAKKKAQKAQSTPESDPDGLRLFTSPNGFRILIGRNNKQNDIVSKKKTKEGDLWFHARGVPGAHVLLKLDGKAQEPDDDDIQCAARLAAYYSKARNDGKVPVAMTRGENVSKPAGAPPGLVQITKERTWNVKPSESLAYKESKDTSE